ncbi:hypothetical protein K461DRAFT_312562 [Myriangium duriaei CBS 260.36]|uniref:Uncharacterized protein n=1 Tax=Myriangium duriaei CBS 260.36 TaxID=1168546 RepID=A0A9P4MHE6_9PEZI|nr:hypothetical protein K461DRAFT_312562 [Myriangium duriaei CBS 260.36]
MCWHVHTRHSFCAHVVCATYPFDCDRGQCKRSCGDMDLQHDVHSLENNACVNCIVREVKVRITRPRNPNSDLTPADYSNIWFGPSEYRAIRYWTEKRNEYTRRFILENPNFRGTYDLTEINPMPDIMAPQTLLYQATPQRREGLGPVLWNLDVSRFGAVMRPHDIAEDWYQKTPRQKSIQEVVNTSRALEGQPLIPAPIIERIPVHITDPNQMHDCWTDQFVGCNSAYWRRPKHPESGQQRPQQLPPQLPPQQPPPQPSNSQGTYQGEESTFSSQDTPDHTPTDLVSNLQGHQPDEYPAIQGSTLLPIVPGEVPTDLGGNQPGYQPADQLAILPADMATDSGENMLADRDPSFLAEWDPNMPAAMATFPPDDLEGRLADDVAIMPANDFPGFLDPSLLDAMPPFSPHDWQGIREGVVADDSFGLQLPMTLDGMPPFSPHDWQGIQEGNMAADPLSLQLPMTLDDMPRLPPNDWQGTQQGQGHGISQLATPDTSWESSWTNRLEQHPGFKHPQNGDLFLPAWAPNPPDEEGRIGQGPDEGTTWERLTGCEGVLDV